jgi:hypothetical protein
MSQPSCFGTNLWSAAAPECIGGPDSAYSNPRTGNNVRERCAWYSSCASVSASNKVRSQNLIPPNQLTRVPIAPVQVMPPPKPAFNPLLPRQNPVYPQHYQQPQQYIAQQAYMVPPWQAQQGPQMVPVVYQQPGSQMPAYLTVPEPVDLDESPWRRLIREIFRSMFKSAGHTTASYFDHTPMRPHAPPPKTPEGQ